MYKRQAVDEIDEINLPLDEFVKLPTTVDFQAINSDRFKQYVKDKPYLRFGTELANNYIVGYTNEKNIPKLLQDIGGDFLYLLPRILSPTDSKSNDVSGITQVANQPFLNLTGRGVVICIVAVSYTHLIYVFCQ